MLSEFYFVPHDAGYLAFPPLKFDLIRPRDAADGWVLDVRNSEKYICCLNFIFVVHECWLLGCYFLTHP
jgi:hypothetical protein